MLAYILLDTTPTSFGRVAENAKGLPNVIDANVILGYFGDVILKVEIEKLEDLNYIFYVFKEIREMREIVKSTTYLVIGDRSGKSQGKTEAYIFVRADPKHAPNLAEDLTEVENIKSVSITLGEPDLIIEVTTKDLNELREMITNIHSHSGIISTSTCQVI